MTSQLTRDSVLRRAGKITLTLHSAGDATAIVDGREVDLGVHALAILAGCVEPTRLADLFDRVSTSGARDYAALLATTLRMLERGILLSDDAPLKEDAERWAAPVVHIGMLDDEVRTRAFLAAIEELTQPNDIVLDIGSGTGVLAVGAARAGAQEVFAIEASAMADKVRALAAANDVTDRLSVIHAWSTRAELPRKATLLVTETLGNDPLDEHIIDIVADAKKRLLAPGARLIPNRIDLYALLVELPPELRERFAFVPGNTARWTARHGIDFGCLSAAPPTGYIVTLSQKEGAQLRELSQPELVGSIDLTGDAKGFDEHTTAISASEAGDCAGVLYYFEAALTPSISVSTRPSATVPTSSWSNAVWLQPEPRPISRGDVVRVAIKSTASRTRVEVVA